MADQFYPIFVSALSDEDGGGYLAVVPDLYGCTGDGDTPADALADAQKAIVEWCNEMRRLGKPIPDPGAALDRVREDRERIRETIRSLGNEIKNLGEEFGKLAKVIETKDKLINSQEKEISTLWRRISDLQATLSDLECEDRPQGGVITGWTNVELARIPTPLRPTGSDRKAH